jgi:hypothetical protein
MRMLSQLVAPVITGAKIHFEDITLKKNFTMIRAMAQEMFASHLFVQEFAKRHPEKIVLINMANPGFSDTGIVRRLPAFLRWDINWLLQNLKSLHTILFISQAMSV